MPAPTSILLIGISLILSSQLLSSLADSEEVFDQDLPLFRDTIDHILQGFWRPILPNESHAWIPLARPPYFPNLQGLFAGPPEEETVSNWS